MKHYPKAHSRTFKVTTHFDCYGEKWGSESSTVRVFLEEGEIKAEKDGQPITLTAAVNTIQAADRVTVIDEVLSNAQAFPAA